MSLWRPRPIVYTIRVGGSLTSELPAARDSYSEGWSDRNRASCVGDAVDPRSSISKASYRTFTSETVEFHSNNIRRAFRFPASALEIELESGHRISNIGQIF